MHSCRPPVDRFVTVHPSRTPDRGQSTPGVPGTRNPLDTAIADVETVYRYYPLSLDPHPSSTTMCPSTPLSPEGAVLPRHSWDRNPWSTPAQEETLCALSSQGWRVECPS